MTKIASTILALLAAANIANAADSQGGAPSRPSDPYMDRFEAAKAKQDWPTAVATMKDAVASKPDNADYHNLYAYSLRKSATPDMDLVFKHYNEALRIDPRNKDAHEYLGEAYLMVGNVQKAKDELAALDKLCFFRCSQFSDLKKAIEQHEARASAK
jgi:cytochrome c-type biogenesis protein CcmH/NrfG